MRRRRSAGAVARLPLLLSILLATSLLAVAPPKTIAGTLASARGSGTAPQTELALTTTASRTGPSIPAVTADTAHLFPLGTDPGAPPTGTITFSVYGPFQAAPTSASCSGPPRWTSTVEVNGFGSYTSSSFGPDSGGFYTWTATYSGDANYTPLGPVGCGEARETVEISRYAASISTQATPSAGLGEPITDRAFVSGWLVTGAVDFRLYGPNDPTCAGPPFSTSVAGLVPTSNAPGFGAGVATSRAFVPTQPGTYRWIASYRGDTSNAPAAGACGDPNEASVVADNCTIRGAGDLAGTEGDDVICGSPGPDRISGLGGHDVILGYAGDDRLVGGGGRDVLLSGDGDDHLTTVDGAGGDVVDAGNHVLGDRCAIDFGDTFANCERTGMTGSPPVGQG